MKTAPTYFEYWAERYRRRAEDSRKIKELLEEMERTWQELTGKRKLSRSGFVRLWG